MQRGGVDWVSDEELRNRVVNQPEQGWSELWERYGGFISAVVRRYSLHTEDSKEILQEVSLRLVKDNLHLLRSWDPGRCVLRGYLAVVTSSVCRSYLRSAYRHNSRLRFLSRDDPGAASQLIPFMYDPTPSPLEHLHRENLETLLKDCFDAWERAGELRHEDRLLLEMRLGGANNLQIARELGISQGNAATRYHRLKQALKRQLSNHGVKSTDLVD
jgi:RNA polymerase sigma factor (sigma-70 family)